MCYNIGRTRLLLLSFSVMAFLNAQSQRTFSIKNNLLYDATLTPNLGAEMMVGRRATFQLFYGLNPWNGYHGQKRLQHWSLMPEYRYWLSGEPFRGWFMGLHAVGGEYNVAGIQLPFGLFETLRHSHYEGWFGGGGLTIGHAWRLSRHWNLEAALGIGYAYTRYSRYENEECGDLLEQGHHNYVGPTKLALNIAYVFGKEPKIQPTPIPQQPTSAVVVIHQPDFQLDYERPKAEAEKTRELNGQAFLDFVVNKTDIRRDYRRNATELAKVEQTINEVRQDSNTTITHIDIHGYASPEGSYQNNVRLAQGRAQAFKDYVQTLIDLPASIFSVASTPEDWQGLIAWIDSNPMALANVKAIRDIVVSDMEADKKEQQLKRLHPAAWRQLLTEVFPALRHSDYRVSYTVRPFSVEEARQLIHTKPQLLSLNEMFLVANTYAPGSQEFNDVFEIAVRMYPQDETANLNAAITALGKNDLPAAERYLEKAGESPTALIARGVLAVRRNDFAAAERFFTQANNDAARHNLNELTLYLNSISN